MVVDDAVRERDAHHATFIDPTTQMFEPPWNKIKDILSRLTEWKQWLPEEVREELNVATIKFPRGFSEFMLQPVAVLACAVMDVAYMEGLDSMYAVPFIS